MGEDSVRINANALHIALKEPEPTAKSIDFLAAIAPILIKGHSHIADAKRFLGDLTERRRSLLAAIRSVASRPEEVDDALAKYSALLHHLMIPPAGRSAPDTKEAPPWREAGIGDVVSVSWEDALFESEPTKGSARFEIASILQAVAMWKAAKAASLVCGSSGAAVDNSVVSKAYQLYREAAGIVQHLSDKHLDGLASCTAGDLDSNIVAGLYKYMLAEAESLTALRAIEKGNIPSLVAGLAMDVSQLYYDAFRCIQRAVAPTAQSFKDASAIAQDRHSGLGGWTGYCRKLGGYLSYKAACFKAYMLGYHALDRMQATQGGEAVRLTQEADKIVRTAAILGREYDNLEPKTSENERHVFALHLKDRMSRIEAQCQKDNIVVYMQRVPDALPELPKAKQLVSAIEYNFPALDASVDTSIISCFDLARSPDYEHVIDIGAKGRVEGDGQQNPQTNWWRWLLAIIAIPILLLISLLGVIIWMVLFPVKVLCCPVGFAAQLLWDVIEWVIKAPAVFMLWAAGKPWKPQKRNNGKTESDGLVSGQ